jgi:hypothetical protein
MKLTQMQEAVDLTFDELIDELCDVKKRQQSINEARWILERRVAELMEADGATTMRTDHHVVTITRPVTYDPGQLAALREITDPLDLAGVYTASHEEVRRVPEKWNMSKGRKLLRLGRAHRSIIEKAMIHGTPKIQVTEQEEQL